jgi:SSS family solute:Na+ symporter
MQIHWIDLAIVIAYLAGILLVGILSSRRQAETTAGYFLAGRSLGWVPIGLALFATNISTVHLIGLASSGYSDGLVVGNFEWMAPFLLILLGLVFAPFYFRTRIATLPEFLEGRYGPAPRTFLAFMGVVGALFIHIGVTLYAGAVLFRSFVEIDILWSILIVSLATVIYTALGGLRAVVITESIQAILLLVGAVAVTGYGLSALGHAGIGSIEALRHAAKPGQLSMIRTDGPFAWWIMLLGYPVLGIWYWCSDQTIVQRVLGARSERDAQLGPILCGFIKILPLFVMVLPGVIGYVLFRDRIGNRPDATLVELMKALLPTGLQGVVLAGLLAALMSTVAGALNSSATLVSIDIVKRLRPDTTERTLVRVGRITVVLVMIAATAWSTLGERFGGIFAGINQMISVLAPPISTVFIWGVFWRRGTAQAAIVTLVSGFVLGSVAFVADFPAFGFQILTLRWGVPFMLQAFFLFAACSLVFVIVSLVTPPPDAARVGQYCWEKPWEAVTGTSITGPLDPRILAVVLVLVMVVLYGVFA